MLLSKETIVKLTYEQENILGHMNYAAFKLWNICNYERRNYKELGLDNYPDWYYQKSAHKNDAWFKSLPSQTAQEVCKQLDKSWKSFYKLKKTGGIENPQPPRFKHDGIPITYMQNGINVVSPTSLRLALPKQLKEYMLSNYNINANYLFLENEIFQNAGVIKQLKIYPPVDGKARVIIIYEREVPNELLDNGHYLSIDLGINNPFTCYDSMSGKSFILGRKYNDISHYYNKEIAYYQSLSDSQQAADGIKYPKMSSRVQRLYTKKHNCLKDYFHKCTTTIVDYCTENNINTLVIGDITGIREDKNFGDATNQHFHAFPYAQVYNMLEYKCALCGIRCVKVKEAYSSQCSPLSPTVSKEYAQKSNRKERGLYCGAGFCWNADSVGAYNILRIYFQQASITKDLPLKGLSSPEYIKVAV